MRMSAPWRVRHSGGTHHAGINASELIPQYNSMRRATINGQWPRWMSRSWMWIECVVWHWHKVFHRTDNVTQSMCVAEQSGDVFDQWQWLSAYKYVNHMLWRNRYFNVASLWQTRHASVVTRAVVVTAERGEARFRQKLLTRNGAILFNTGGTLILICVNLWSLW